VNRSLLFWLAIAAGVILVILTILFYGGAFGHNHDGPGGLNHFKRGSLCLILAVVSFLFAVVMRPRVRASS
jgi:hypothetical protein